MIDTTTPWSELEQQPAQAPMIDAMKVHDDLPESEPKNQTRAPKMPKALRDFGFIKSDAKQGIPKPSKAPAKPVRKYALLTLCIAMAAGGLWWYSDSPLIPTGVKKAVVPLSSLLTIGGSSSAKPNDPTLAQAEPPSTVPAARTAPEAKAASDAPPVDPVWPATSTQQVAADDLAAQTTASDAIAPAIALAAPAEAGTIESREQFDQRLSKLENEFLELRDWMQKQTLASTASMQVATAQPVKSSRPTSRTTARRVAKSPKPVEENENTTTVAEPKYSGQVLSVDLWDGKPSVVVVTGDPVDKRTVVMQPGDSLNGISLREASVQDRSASFDVGGGKLLTLNVGDEQ